MLTAIWSIFTVREDRSTVEIKPSLYTTFENELPSSTWESIIESAKLSQFTYHRGECGFSRLVTPFLGHPPGTFMINAPGIICLGRVLPKAPVKVRISKYQEVRTNHPWENGCLIADKVIKAIEKGEEVYIDFSRTWSGGLDSLLIAMMTKILGKVSLEEFLGGVVLFNLKGTQQDLLWQAVCSTLVFYKLYLNELLNLSETQTVVNPEKDVFYEYKLDSREAS